MELHLASGSRWETLTPQRNARSARQQPWGSEMDLPDLNWKRGFLRLWTVSSGLWVAYVFVSGYLEHGLSAPQALFSAAAVPICVLVAAWFMVWIGAWIGRGFKRVP